MMHDQCLCNKLSETSLINLFVLFLSRYRRKYKITLVSTQTRSKPMKFFFVFLSAFLVVHIACAQVNLNNGLLAYYPFNGDAKDASGNGNDGTPQNGAQLTTDRFGNPNSAYYFDGIDDYISINDNGKLSPC